MFTIYQYNPKITNMILYLAYLEINNYKKGYNNKLGQIKRVV